MTLFSWTKLPLEKVEAKDWGKPVIISSYMYSSTISEIWNVEVHRIMPNGESRFNPWSTISSK